MSPELGRSWFRVAVFLTLVSLFLLLVVSPGTAEFYITIATLLVGLVFIAVIVIVVRRSR
jgi:nitrogen fixation/metabolism regulation signal transduction histidine kinase